MDTKKRAIIVIFFLLIIGGLVYFFTLNNNTGFSKYNGFKIYRTETDTYNIEIYFQNDDKPHYISTRYNPKDLEYIKIEDNLRKKLLKNEIFVTMSPNLSAKAVVALAEISKITANPFLYNIPTKGALIVEKGNNPVKTCKDASKQMSIVFLKLSNKTEVYSKDECIIVEGINEEELIKASTRLTLNTLEIMN